MANFKIVVFLAFVLLFVVTDADYCTPGIVPGVAVTEQKQLQWSAVLNPLNCSISQYIINIFDPEDGSQLQFQASSNSSSYDVSFLDMCKTYSFKVHALTDKNVLGPADRVDVKIPPSANVNLTLSVTNPIVLVDNQVKLTWDSVNSEATKCISYYRVVYWDENNSPTDVYVPRREFVLPENLVPCMKYTFQVSAIVENPDTRGPATTATYPGFSAVTGTPKLVNLVSGKSSVNMTWAVPTYAENRCQLLALVVDTLGLPANTSTTIIQIQDDPLRSNVDVSFEDLAQDTIYTSRVALQNVAGYSQNVTVMFQTFESFIFNYERDIIYDY